MWIESFSQEHKDIKEYASVQADIKKELTMLKQEVFYTKNQETNKVDYKYSICKNLSGN